MKKERYRILFIKDNHHKKAFLMATDEENAETLFTNIFHESKYDEIVQVKKWNECAECGL